MSRKNSQDPRRVFMEPDGEYRPTGGQPARRKRHTLRNVFIGGVAVAAILGGCTAMAGGGDDNSASDGAQTSQATATSATSSAGNSTTTAPSKKAQKAVPASMSHLTFKVTSDTASTADITVTYSNENGGQVQKQETVKLPYTKTVDFKRYSLKPSGANILAQVGDNGGTDITATVTWNDDEPSTSQGSGEYASAMAVLS